jgi:hypothetical protein
MQFPRGIDTSQALHFRTDSNLSSQASILKLHHFEPDKLDMRTITLVPSWIALFTLALACNDGDKRCSSAWWGIQCVDGQWKNIHSCAKGTWKRCRANR